MPIEKLRPSFSFDEDRLKELKKITPEAFADGKINWEVLKEALGEHLEDDSGEVEHFGLFWPGKKEARRIASIPSKGTLIPVYGEGLKSDGTPDSDGVNDSHNIFIEGENFEVLKILQKSYAGRVKMIYIDPPYNTGNDFIYDDNFTEPLEEYLRKTGQIDSEGKSLTTNKKADGRFHSKWLNMMYPRLRLARSLLREDGFIYISIDDNEVNNLKFLMDEIFGEENFVEAIIWKKKYGGGAKTKYFVSLHEYILCYSNAKFLIDNIEKPYNEGNRKYYKFRDDKYDERGPFRLQPLATNSNDPRPNLRYPIIYNNLEIWPEKQWQWSKERTLKAIENDEIVFTPKGESFSVNFKQYLIDDEGKERKAKPFSIIDNVFTQHGTNEIKELFGDGQVFPFPKPSVLLKQLMEISLENNDIIMDFFAGSGTTAHALMNYNSEYRRNNKFILIQLPETIDEDQVAFKYGYKKITEITKSRIRKVIDIHKRKNENFDIGFRSFTLKKSILLSDDNFQATDIVEYQLELDKSVNRLANLDRVDDLIYEIILIEGFPLDSKIVIDPLYNKNQVQKVTSEFCGHQLLICLDQVIEKDTVDKLLLGEKDIFICLDSSIMDQDKIKLSDKGLIKTV